MKPLLGQKALVTGASSGIGRAVALSLGEAGADVLVNYVSGEDEAQALVAELRAKGAHAMAVRADVSDEGQVRQMFWQMIDEFGTIDLLVSNAGSQQDVSFNELTLAQWNKVIAGNLTGHFLCSREAVREFMRRGVRQDVSRSAGKIICISSVHEVISRAGHVSYSASKGVMLMIKNLAQEVAPYRIRVNWICPGAIRTPINMQAWDTAAACNELMKPIPHKQIGAPEEIGPATVWLASDHADDLHGAGLFVDGGMTRCSSPLIATTPLKWLSIPEDNV
jgi:glucose 1-dehydrogenase